MAIGLTARPLCCKRKKKVKMENFQYSYLVLAIVIWILGYFHNGRFVRPKWKIPGKFIFYNGISYILILWYQEYALFFILGHPIIGLIFHTIVCVKYDINWFTCYPEEKYLELTEKLAKQKSKT